MHIREHVELGPLTTLGVGGPARFFADAESAEQAREAVEWARSRALPLFVLGGGSNLLVSDRGFPGLVVRIGIRGVEQIRDDGREVFSAGAGESWDALVERTVNANCAGLECLSGIPGTVGGTPVQNVGAYGQQVADTITEVEVLDLRSGMQMALPNEQCGFEYRRSMFNTRERDRYVILRVRYAVNPGGEPHLAYRDVREYFRARDISQPTLAQVRQAIREIRCSKAMLLVDGDEDVRSAGSFFKNPVLSAEAYRELQQTTAAQGARVPTYPAEGQQFKVPAAWLVEQAGYRKGYSRGKVGISRKHALAIVNRGGASAADVVALKNDIQAAVRRMFGIELSPEPVEVGF